MPVDVLLRQTSPFGTVEAVVEADDGVVVLYLWGAGSEKFHMRSCWVRNLLPAPADFDAARLDEGRPPLLPASFCNHPEGSPTPDRHGLRIVWSEAGDGAALLEGDSYLAILPPGRLKGFARDCVAANTECLPLLHADAGARPHFDSFRRAESFWHMWATDPWPTIRPQRVGAVEGAMGPAMGYYAIDGGKWPPRGMLRFERPAQTILLTVGLCLCPQPAAGATADCRIELAVAFDPNFGDEVWEDLARFLNPLTIQPWKTFAPLADGQVVECKAMPAGPGGVRFTHALLWRDPPGAPALGVGPLRGEPVSVLWIVPITAGEKRLLSGDGDATELKRRLAAGEEAWIHRDRPERS